MSGKQLPVGEPHEPSCPQAWTCDGVCSCGPEGKAMQREWRNAIAIESKKRRAAKEGA